jgi:hypothetical protein
MKDIFLSLCQVFVAAIRSSSAMVDQNMNESGPVALLLNLRRFRGSREDLHLFTSRNRTH